MAAKYGTDVSSASGLSTDAAPGSVRRSVVLLDEGRCARRCQPAAGR